MNTNPYAGKLGAPDPKLQEKLQELLVEAKTALDRVGLFAEEHDLQFEFHGFRRGPEDKGEWSNGGHYHDLYENLDDNSSVVKSSVLDISNEWVGSGAWC